MRDIVHEIRSRNIPMDILVIDMDWHRNGKTGKRIIPSGPAGAGTGNFSPIPRALSPGCIAQHLSTTLNLHPADGVYPKEDHYDELYADLSKRYSDITADSLSTADGTIAGILRTGIL